MLARAAGWSGGILNSRDNSRVDNKQIARPVGFGGRIGGWINGPAGLHRGSLKSNKHTCAGGSGGSGG